VTLTPAALVSRQSAAPAAGHGGPGERGWKGRGAGDPLPIASANIHPPRSQTRKARCPGDLGGAASGAAGPDLPAGDAYPRCFIDQIDHSAPALLQEPADEGIERAGMATAAGDAGDRLDGRRRRIQECDSVGRTISHVVKPFVRKAALRSTSSEISGHMSVRRRTDMCPGYLPEVNVGSAGRPSSSSPGRSKLSHNALISASVTGKVAGGRAPCRVARRRRSSARGTSKKKHWSSEISSMPAMPVYAIMALQDLFGGMGAPRSPFTPGRGEAADKRAVLFCFWGDWRVSGVLGQGRERSRCVGPEHCSGPRVWR
jgi:hypothetical protein